jgi:hypothetical protein
MDKTQPKNTCDQPAGVFLVTNIWVTDFTLLLLLRDVQRLQHFFHGGDRCDRQRLFDFFPFQMILHGGWICFTVK